MTVRLPIDPLDPEAATAAATTSAAARFFLRFAGNGVIPNASAANSTLLSMASAVTGARRIAYRFGGRGMLNLPSN